MANDPRITDPPKSANEKIQDRTIRHSVFLERLKASEVIKVNKILNKEVYPDLLEKIEIQIARITQRGTDLGKGTLKRLQTLENFIKKSSEKMSTTIQTDLVVDLDLLARNELEWQVLAIRNSVGFDLEMVIPNPGIVSAKAIRTPFLGSNLEEWFETLAVSNQRRLNQAIRIGIVEGETTQQIVKRIRGSRALGFSDGVLKVTTNQAEAIARSAINHVTNQARLELFKENRDIIKGLQWTATLDSRTSVICAGLDGKVFKIDVGPRPPAHVNCRSTMTAVLKSARQIGLNKIPEGKRASINGQVPATLTYPQWLKGQPVAIQETVLGKTKAKLFRNGDLKIERFTNSSLKPLNLDELRKLEKTSFKKAGLEL